MKRGQGTFEYVLLLGGVLLIVIEALVILQSTANQSFQGLGKSECPARLLTEIGCNNVTGWNACGVFDNATYSNCAFGPGVGVTTYPSGCPLPAPVLSGNQLFCGNKPFQ